VPLQRARRCLVFRILNRLTLALGSELPFAAVVAPIASAQGPSILLGAAVERPRHPRHFVRKQERFPDVLAGVVSRLRKLDHRALALIGDLPPASVEAEATPTQLTRFNEGTLKKRSAPGIVGLIDRHFGDPKISLKPATDISDEGVFNF